VGYLEKVFLGTMVLFALVIGFLFSLYFDLGKFLQGEFTKADTITRGAAVDRLVDRLEHTARTRPEPGEPVRREGNRCTRTAPSFAQSRAAVAERYAALYRPHRPSRDERVEQYRRFLVSQGFSNKAYIELESLAQDRRALQSVLPTVRASMHAGDYDSAVLMLEQALRDVPEANMHLRLEIISMLSEAHIMAKDLGKARESVQRGIELQQRILDIKSKTILMDIPHVRETIEEQRSTLAQRRGDVDKAFTDMQRRIDQTGSVDGFTSEEQTTIKLKLGEMLRDGKITSQQQAAALATMDKGFFDGARTKWRTSIKSGAADTLDGP